MYWVQISISLNVERLAEKLDGKSIVTSITVCPAYVLYLSSDSKLFLFILIFLSD